MRRDPAHRFQAVQQALEAKVPPVPALELSLFQLLETQSCPEPEVEYAYEIYSNPDHRTILDAFILAQASPEQIAETLKIPVPVITLYRELFLDISVLRDRLELLSYANAYEGPAAAKELMRTAVTVGASYLTWAYSGEVVDIDPRLVIRRTMLDAFFRGMAHKGNSLTSNMAREAQKWWATAVRNAELLEKVDPRITKAAVDELRIALEGKDDTLASTNSPVALEDILH